MSVVIIGNGMAGATVAATLRTKGYEGAVVLVGEEAHPPYQRPPLSKEQLKEGGDPLLVRPEGFWADKDIELVSGVRATAIDRDARTVALADGRSLEYEHLVLATGARNRALPGADGAFAERVAVPATGLKRIPAGVDARIAASAGEVLDGIVARPA